jgi:hypothetical protein
MIVFFFLGNTHLKDVIFVLSIMHYFGELRLKEWREIWRFLQVFVEPTFPVNKRIHFV